MRKIRWLRIEKQKVKSDKKPIGKYNRNEL